MVFAAFVVVAAFVVQTDASPTAPATQEVDPVEQQLEAIRVKAKLPALGGAIVTTDGLEDAWVTGIRANGHPEEVELDDAWHLGSCTKSMTATLIALLVEAGKLSWETPLEKLLPECAATMDEAYKKVTLVQLLTHRAGVPNDATRDGLWTSFWTAGEKETPTQQRARMAKAILSWPPIHAPGTKYTYSNFGVSIAGYVAEVVMKESYETLMIDWLFDPLGMTTAGFGAPSEQDKNGAIDAIRGHRADGTTVEPGPRADNPPAIGPGGRVHASLGDWAKYLALHLKGTKGDVKVGEVTLEKETFAKLQTAWDAPDDKYAMGWLVGQRDWAGGDGKVLTHSGSNTIWYCVTWLAPNAGFGVLATTNRVGTTGQRATDEVCQSLIQEHTRRAKAK